MNEYTQESMVFNYPRIPRFEAVAHSSVSAQVR
jgi:hypothetical protein